MVLLVGGVLVGYPMGESGYRQVRPFFESSFKDALALATTSPFHLIVGIPLFHRFAAAVAET